MLSKLVLFLCAAFWASRILGAYKKKAQARVAEREAAVFAAAVAATRHACSAHVVLPDIWPARPVVEPDFTIRDPPPPPLKAPYNGLIPKCARKEGPPAQERARLHYAERDRQRREKDLARQANEKVARSNCTATTAAPSAFPAAPPTPTAESIPTTQATASVSPPLPVPAPVPVPESTTSTALEQDFLPSNTNDLLRMSIPLARQTVQDWLTGLSVSSGELSARIMQDPKRMLHTVEQIFSFWSEWMSHQGSGWDYEKIDKVGMAWAAPIVLTLCTALKTLDLKQPTDRPYLDRALQQVDGMMRSMELAHQHTIMIEQELQHAAINADIAAARLQAEADMRKAAEEAARQLEQRRIQQQLDQQLEQERQVREHYDFLKRQRLQQEARDRYEYEHRLLQQQQMEQERQQRQHEQQAASERFGLGLRRLEQASHEVGTQSGAATTPMARRNRRTNNRGRLPALRTRGAQVLAQPEAEGTTQAQEAEVQKIQAHEEARAEVDLEKGIQDAFTLEDFVGAQSDGEEAAPEEDEADAPFDQDAYETNVEKGPPKVEEAAAALEDLYDQGKWEQAQIDGPPKVQLEEDQEDDSDLSSPPDSPQPPSGFAGSRVPPKAPSCWPPGHGGN